MSHLMFLWIATLTSFAVLDFLLAQLCRSFGFASTRFELRSPVRGHYLQTNVYSFVCFLVVTLLTRSH